MEADFKRAYLSSLFKLLLIVTVAIIATVHTSVVESYKFHLHIFRRVLKFSPDPDDCPRELQ
jgi:hypothetical protein